MASTSDTILPPIDPATGLPQTPAVQAALQAVDLDPTLTIPLEDGTEIAAADLIAQLVRDHEKAQADAQAMTVAASCFLRSL